MSEEVLLLEVDEHGVATLTLNRPEKRNPFSPELVDAFAARIDEVEANRDVRVLVVTGAGRAFCAGADFKTMPTLAARSGPVAGWRRASR